MNTKATERGFTFVEILVAIAILAIITAFSVSAFRNVYLSSSVRTVSEEVRDSLREARNNTIAAKGNTTFGVYIATSSVTRFVGDTYVAGHASNTVYTFDAGASATGTLVGPGIAITFARLTGAPSATGTIYIHNADMTSTTTITIESTGLVQ